MSIATPSDGHRVEILTFAACPNAQPTIELLERIILELGAKAELVRIEVKDEDEAQAMRFLGSPSVRIDGRDIEPGANERTNFAFSCRVYGTGNGFSGLPREDWIRTAFVD